MKSNAARRLRLVTILRQCGSGMCDDLQPVAALIRTTAPVPPRCRSCRAIAGRGKTTCGGFFSCTARRASPALAAKDTFAADRGEHLAKDVAVFLAVIHDQGMDALSGFKSVRYQRNELPFFDLCGGRAIWKKKREPMPRSDCICSRPPSSSTCRSAMASPRPVPP